MEASRDEHLECRSNQSHLEVRKSSACEEYDTYRTSVGATTPNCMSTVLSSAAISTADPQEQAEMEQCLEKVFAWHRPLHTKYMICSNRTAATIARREECDNH